VDNGGDNSAGHFGIKIGADTAKFTDVRIAGFGQCGYLVRKVRCSSKIKSRLRAELVVLRGQFYILASCRLSPLRRNLVSEELRVERFAVIYLFRRRCVLERYEVE